MNMANAIRVLPRECTGHSRHPHPTTQTGLYTWTSPDGQYWNQTDYILCSWRWRSSTQSAKTRLGTDCGSDHELLIAKIRPKSKKVGKTTRLLRYDVNQISYDCTVKVRNRFKGLDLTDRGVKNYRQRFKTLYRKQWSKPSPTKVKCKKAKWLAEEVLWIAEKRREAKGKGDKERYTHLNAEFQRIMRNKKAFLSLQCKETEENNRMEKTRYLFKKIRDTKGTFHAKTGTKRTEMVLYWT